MTPKEKARELIKSFVSHAFYHTDFTAKDRNTERIDHAKSCAIIAVDEILNGAMVWQFIEGNARVYWQQVKDEIEKL